MYKSTNHIDRKPIVYEGKMLDSQVLLLRFIKYLLLQMVALFLYVYVEHTFSSQESVLEFLNLFSFLLEWLSQVMDVTR